MKLFDLLTLSSCSSPDRTAIIDRELKLSYRELRARVEILLGVLKKCRCTENTGVALVLDNCAEYFISFFAVSAAGGTIVPLSTRMAPPEVQAFVKKCDASFVITDEKYLKRLSLKTMRAADVTVLCIELNKKGELIIKNLFLRKNTTSEQDTSSALMVPTSGSTGQPKIVMLTDDQLISNMAVYQTAMGFHQHNVVFCALSFHHIYCICAQLLTHTSRADTFVISSKPFFIKDFLKAVREHSVTITAFVPYFAILLSEFDTPDYLTPLTLKYVTLSGAKTPRKIYKTLRNKYPWINFINTYGMSEAGSRISIAAPYFKEFPPDSVGKPMPGVQVKIMDVWGEYLPANRPGQISVKSSGVMKGYYKQPWLTRRNINKGWLKTGDLGKIDGQGNLYILGRTKDTIISGGENVCPQEIEECLLEHPKVKEAAVLGRKDRLLGEVPFAFIVKREDKDELTCDDLIKFCNKRLSSYKIPTGARFVKKLPKLGSAKIDRKTLKKSHKSLLSKQHIRK